MCMAIHVYGYKSHPVIFIWHFMSATTHQQINVYDFYWKNDDRASSTPSPVDEEAGSRAKVGIQMGTRCLVESLGSRVS